MSNIDKQWLQQTIAEYEANRDELPFGLDTNSAIELEAFKLALASLEAEPVAYLTNSASMTEVITSHHFGGDSVSMRRVAESSKWKPLFTAPPAPVSVPDYPETLPCPVMLEPGLRFGKGVHTKMVLDALQRRAEYYAELDAMTPEQRAQHDVGMKEFAAMLQGADGNSPVIPDGWKLVPIELTPRMITKLQQNTEIGSYIAANWAGAYDLFQKFWDEAIAAAPQQEDL